MGFSSAIAMTFGPYGSTQALYYASFAGGGEIRRIAYTSAPTADFTATPTFGSLPLNVSFDGSTSQDPNGLSLTYDWTFGDGGVLNGQTAATANHSYTAAGTYTATLVVRNSNGAASPPATRLIHAGGQGPEAVIDMPDPGPGYAVGQTVTVSGSATDLEDGELPPSALSWSVRLYHVDQTHPGNIHYHPHTSLSGSDVLTFTVPQPEDIYASALSYLEVRLTATDSDGLTDEAAEAVQPQRVVITFNTSPPGLRLNVRELNATTPFTATVWPNWQVPVTAPAVQFKGFGTLWNFEDWSDGGAATHNFDAPSAPMTLTADYDSAPALTVFLPIARR
jgi:hypothetical protein